MDVNKIMTLLDKGFTADEVRRMGLLDADPTPDKPADGARAEPAPKKEEPKPEPVSNNEEKPAEEPKAGQDPVLEAIEKLTGTVLRFMSGSTGREGQPGETADDILAKVFYPQKAEEVD